MLDHVGSRLIFSLSLGDNFFSRFVGSQLYFSSIVGKPHSDPHNLFVCWLSQLKISPRKSLNSQARQLYPAQKVGLTSVALDLKQERMI